MTSRKIPESAVENLVSDLEGKANVSNTVTTDTAQTISGSKRFTKPSAGMSIELVADTNQQTIPSTTTIRQLVLYRNSTYTKGDGYTSLLQGYRGSEGWTTTEIYARRFLEGDSQLIINYIKVGITPDGIPISYTKTPPANSAGEEIVTAGWFRQSGCTARTVTETYVNGTNWYRIWSDGWCEQGGVISAAQNGTTINFLKPFINANYVVVSSQMYRGYTDDPYNGNNEIGGIEPSRCVFYSGVKGNNTQRWIAQGYIA